MAEDTTNVGRSEIVNKEDAGVRALADRYSIVVDLQTGKFEKVRRAKSRDEIMKDARDSGRR